MNRKTSLLLCALLLGAVASPSAIAGTMILDSFAEATGPIDEVDVKVLMATVNTTGTQGGNDASDTTVSIGGSVLATDIGEVCVNYNAVEISCQTNPSSKTNIVLALPGNQKGGAPFTYHVTLNTSAAGKDIQLTVEAIGNTNLTDNIPLPQSTTLRTIFSSAGVAPTVDNPTSANLTYDNPTWSADLGGRVADAGTPNTLSGGCGVDWGTAPADPPTTPYPNSASGGVPCSGTGDIFTVNVSGLPSSSTIYFRPWADNGLRDYSTTEGQFNIGTVVEPTVTVSPTVDNISSDSADLTGQVTDDGGDTVTDHGMVWDTQQHPEQSLNNVVSLGSGLDISGTIQNLPAGTIIYYEAYATNSAGTGYSNSDFSFQTQTGPATVTTAVEGSVTATTAVLGGEVTNDGGAAITDQGIVWSTTPLPQVSVDTTVQMGTLPGPFNDTVGNLVPASDIALPTGQLVYFRAYAINSEGTAYGNQRSFTPAGPPELTALTADNVTLYSGTMHGRLDNDGGNTLTDCGIAWGNTSGGPYPNLESVGLCTAGVSFEVTLSSLPGTTVYYKAYATNDLAQTTLSVEPAVTSGQESFTTLTEPTVQASNVTFPQESGGAMRISWTRGNGTGVIVVMRLDTVGRTDPQDGDDYLASQDFTAAPELPVNSNNFVVYKGSAGGVLVTDLAPNTAYSVVVYEYTGTGASTDYLLVDAPSATNTGSHSTTDVPVHNMDFGVNCDQCHNHGSFGTNGDAGLILSCQNCHALGQAAQAKQEFSNHVTPKARDGGPHPDGLTYVDCGMCHELHNPGGTNTTSSYNPLTDQTAYNKSFLRANVSKYVPGAIDGAFLHNDQPLREVPNDSGYPETPADTPERAVEDGTDTTARGYCQICHTETDYHTNNPSVTLSDQCHDGQTGNCGPAEAHCGECHEHNDTFRGKGGTTTCMVCHASETDLGTSTRREVMTEFDHARPDGNPPDESSHIYAGSGLIQEADCLVCHAFSETHQGQYVSLYDVDDSPAASPRTIYAQSQEEISAQIPAQGAPLSQHCLSCHEDGTPAFLPPTGGDQTQGSPFTNSNSAPIFSGAGLWTNASHNNAATIGCVGCHVGHGSTAVSLLDPNPPVFTVSSPAETDDYFTNFCINCHDADGPSGANIAAEFNTGTDYVVTGMNSQTNNQRHDVTGASPPAVGCPDCHSPHVDNATNPVRDPETGAVIPNYTKAGVWNGEPYDSGGNSDPSNPEGGGSVTEPDYIQFCLVCHDGTPAGGSVAAYDIASDYLGGKQHGNGDGSTGTRVGKGNLKPPWTTAADYAANQDPANNYAALNCTTCHGPHGTGNIYSLRESITVAGTPMEIGSDDLDGQYPKPTFSGFTYTLPLDDATGLQFRDGYGAWCTFCHNMNSGHTGVTEQSNCNSGHRHGGNNF